MFQLKRIKKPHSYYTEIGGKIMEREELRLLYAIRDEMLNAIQDGNEELAKKSSYKLSNKKL